MYILEKLAMDLLEELMVYAATLLRNGSNTPNNETWMYELGTVPDADVMCQL